MNAWIAGARPRTLPAAVVPVVVGTAVAVAEIGAGDVVWWRAGAALAVALAIQVGTNYANDHSDGVRGTDEHRVGPVRLVASGLASAREVLVASVLAFTVAGVAGLALAAATTWWLIPIGAVCVAAGWLYTGGPRPYGYAGLGEAAVFVFFGLVATTGSAFVHTDAVTVLAVAASIPVGCLATALLVVNNLRDIPTDEPAGKRTLAVRLGDVRTRRLYVGLLAAAYTAPVVVAVAGAPASLAALATLPLAAEPARAVAAGAAGRDLIAVLGSTGRLQLAFGVVMAAGVAVGQP